MFIDCQYECDTEYLRQNVQFVDYVRDRTVADVHVLVTTQGTGGGGSAWTVKFIGLGRFDKVDRTLTFNTGPTATSDDRRKEFARIFKLGVASYAADSSAGAQLDVQWLKPAAATATAKPAKDPWNYWVFRTNLSGNRDGEESQNSSSYRASFSANRTTEQWKISFSTNGNYSKSEFDLGEEDGGLIKSTSHSWSVDSLIVKSLGPKWSIGGRSSLSHSSFSNTDKVFTFAPGVEFSVFPYSESSRRGLTLLYTLGASHYDYKDVTIFDKLTETVPNHSLNTQLGLRQPWGSMNAGVDPVATPQQAGPVSHFDVCERGRPPVQGLLVQLFWRIRSHPRSDLAAQRRRHARGSPAAPAATGHRTQLLHGLRHQLQLRLDLQQRRQPPLWRRRRPLHLFLSTAGLRARA